MADNIKGKSDSPPKLQEEPILARLQSSPGQTPTGITSFVGLLGRSPKQGFWLLYLTLDMTKSVEIQETDIIHSEQLPADQSPFGSLGGTRVFVKQDASVTTTQSVSRKHDASAAADEFDLDIQLGAAPQPPIPITRTDVGFTCDDTCPRTQCDTCPITHCATCRTCNTRCGQNTCAATCPNTCANTCQTCNTNCGTCGPTCPNTCANTCQTCHTNCGTCPTNTCATCFTRCQQNTCPRTQCDTCITCHTCDTGGGGGGGG